MKCQLYLCWANYAHMYAYKFTTDCTGIRLILVSDYKISNEIFRERTTITNLQYGSMV